MNVAAEKIPSELRALNQWVVWRHDLRNGEKTKVPYNRNGIPAKANDPSTWGSFNEIWERYQQGGYEGPGFEFSASDPYVGIDLDGCYDYENKRCSEWAGDILRRLDSYAELSPSQTGIKVWVKGEWPYGGKQKAIETRAICSKKPAIEVYSSGRYFAMTGWKVGGPDAPQPRQKELDALFAQFWKPVEVHAEIDFYSDDAVLDRARKYLAKVTPSVSGSKGHNAAFTAACSLVLGFGLNEAPAMLLMREWNQSCVPPWSEKELLHKVQQAAKQPGPRNYLRNQLVHRFDSIPVQKYREPIERPEPKQTTLSAAAEKFLESIRERGEEFISTGIPKLDFAIAGGFAWHEFVLMCGRPSHGKSVVGLQFIHHWTEHGLPCAMVSEEMSAIALGKRTVQYASSVPAEHWQSSFKEVAKHVFEHFSNRAECHVIEGCNSATVAVERIRLLVQKHGVRCAVVDYAQLLGGAGRERYDRLTASCQELRRLANEENILLFVLCQLNRAIESRKQFKPQLSDIKETGQYEQDADVILFGVWPHRLDDKNDPKRYQFFILKNRNRSINKTGVEVEFMPSRQKLIEPKPPNYVDAFAEYDTSGF